MAAASWAITNNQVSWIWHVLLAQFLFTLLGKVVLCQTQNIYLVKTFWGNGRELSQPPTLLEVGLHGKENVQETLTPNFLGSFCMLPAQWRPQWKTGKCPILIRTWMPHCIRAIAQAVQYFGCDSNWQQIFKDECKEQAMDWYSASRKQQYGDQRK